jgi:hypothetical protein
MMMFSDSYQLQTNLHSISEVVETIQHSGSLTFSGVTTEIQKNTSHTISCFTLIIICGDTGSIFLVLF